MYDAGIPPDKTSRMSVSARTSYYTDNSGSSKRSITAGSTGA